LKSHAGRLKSEFVFVVFYKIPFVPNRLNGQ